MGRKIRHSFYLEVFSKRRLCGVKVQLSRTSTETLTTANMTFKIRMPSGRFDGCESFLRTESHFRFWIIDGTPHGLFVILFFSLVLKALFATYKNTIPELRTLGADRMSAFSVSCLADREFVTSQYLVLIFSSPVLNDYNWLDADKGLEIIRSLSHKSDKLYTIAFPTKTLKTRSVLHTKQSYYSRQNAFPLELMLCHHLDFSFMIRLAKTATAFIAANWLPNINFSVTRVWLCCGCRSASPHENILKKDFNRKTSLPLLVGRPCFIKIKRLLSPS